MIIDFKNISDSTTENPNKIDVNGVCPGCGEKTKFLHIEGCYDVVLHYNYGAKQVLGQRICPDEKCRTHIFFQKHISPNCTTYTNIIPQAYTVKNITMQKLPEDLRDSLQESITCFKNSCYTASAIMIRKTLENICLINNATGKDLHARLNALKDKVILSNTLYEALFELKYLGNDAAHVESKHFEKIEKEEAELGITILIEILRALYEHKDLLDSFKALKKTT